MGRLMLMPKMLALITVQRQTAASKSASPSMRLQHGVTGGSPIVTLTRLPSTSRQTPNLRASLGHELPGLGSVVCLVAAPVECPAAGPVEFLVAGSVESSVAGSVESKH